MSSRTKHRARGVPAAPAGFRRDAELLKVAYAAAHDLNSPLRKIGTFGDLLKQRLAGRADPIDLDYLDRMRRAAAAASRIVGDLLTLVRLEHEDLPAQRVELDAVLAAVKKELADDIAATGAVIEASPLPAVLAPTGLPHLLLSALLSNAVKFGAPGRPPTVRVEARRDGSVLELRVSDDGLGFDAAYEEKIFQAFTRLNYSGSYAGHGLGLAIARGAARRIGGDLTARSDPGRGATFIARLPASILAS